MAKERGGRGNKVCSLGEVLGFLHHFPLFFFHFSIPPSSSSFLPFFYSLSFIFFLPGHGATRERTNYTTATDVLMSLSFPTSTRVSPPHHHLLFHGMLIKPVRPRCLAGTRTFASFSSVCSARSRTLPGRPANCSRCFSTRFEVNFESQINH